MKKVFLASLILISTSLNAADDCVWLEPTDSRFGGDCLESEPMNDAIDLLNSNAPISEEVRFREIASDDDHES